MEGAEVKALASSRLPGYATVEILLDVFALEEKPGGSMIEVHRGIFIGQKDDCPLHGARLSGQWAIVHAYPVCHRAALGYTTRAIPEGPEQYLARQGHHLLLNMLDSERPGFYYKEAMIDPALAFIDEMRAAGANILIHCAQGMSRSPSLALLYLATRLGALPAESLGAAEEQFKVLYPRYTPGYGIWAHLKQHWQAYCADGKRFHTNSWGC
jgi:hypothetical protein